MAAIPKKMKNSKGQWESAQMNMDTYSMYYSRLKNIALTMFDWKGLPASVSERFLELTLFEQGHAAFVNDDTLGFLGLGCTIGGPFNVYTDPTEIQAYSTSGYSKSFTPDKDAVVIYNNNMREPGELPVRLYAQRLYEVERTIDVNIKAQKTPILILCDEQQRLTLKNLYMQYDGNEPFIFGNKSLDISQFQVLQTNAPFVADKLIHYKHNLWNECMTYFGLANTNTDKKERLVEAEATSNDEQIEASRNAMLSVRQLAAEKINKLFGLNVTVNFKVKVQQKEDEKEDLELKKDLNGVAQRATPQKEKGEKDFD